MKKPVLAILLAITAIPAMAQDDAFSAEILSGTTEQEIIGTFDRTKEDDTSFGIRGAYSINKNIALELAYMDHGETDDTYVGSRFGNIVDARISSRAVNLGVKGMMPFANGFSLHARSGISFWNATLKETSSFQPGITLRGDDSGKDFYYGIGAQYAINAIFTIGAEYTLSEYRFKPGSFSNTDADMNVRTLALTAGFNF